MSVEQIRPNLLTVVPGNINIENFVPGRVYKETLMIYNTCNVPIVLNLKSSDKNKLTISESKMRIGVNQSKKLDLIIQDKLNYKYTKGPIKPRKLFIHLKGDLIDEKYEINLIYYNKNNNKNNEHNSVQFEQNDPNLIYSQGNDISNKYMLNSPYNEIPQGYLTQNPNNYMNKENIKDSCEDNFENNYYRNCNKPIQDKNFYNNYTDKKNICMQISQKDNDEVINLKNIINDLMNKIMILKNLLEQKKINEFNENYFDISHDSLYIFGDNSEKELKNKYKLDENIENERIKSRNKILEIENSTLLYRIKCLEKKLSLNSNYNENNIDSDINKKFEYKNYNEDDNINKNYLKEDSIYQNDDKNKDLISELKMENLNKFNNSIKKDENISNLENISMNNNNKKTYFYKNNNNL